MNVNFGLFPPLETVAGKRIHKKERRTAISARALADLESWSSGNRAAAE